jgi:hypothetical protein
MDNEKLLKNMLNVLESIDKRLEEILEQLQILECMKGN